MRLPRPFYRLPVRFDAARLQAELEALPDTAWARHPKEFEGNASIRLISVDGAENDGMRGVMRPTPHLQACPYVRQVLASFGVVWSRSRFMRLSARSNVPEHADTSYHWFHRVRLHIPVITWPEVTFSCGDESVHMAAGEAWLFDNWRRHSVVNPTDHDRVHLVADTFGNSRFWQYVVESVEATQERAAALPSGIRCPGLDGAGRAAAGAAAGRGRVARPGYRRRAARGAGCAGDGREHHRSTRVCCSASAATGASSMRCTARAPAASRPIAACWRRSMTPRASSRTAWS